MLVLSRRQDERIVIGGNIVVTIVGVRGDKVRVGVDAPRDVTVHREEVQQRLPRWSADQAVSETDRVPAA